MQKQVEIQGVTRLTRDYNGQKDIMHLFVQSDQLDTAPIQT